MPLNPDIEAALNRQFNMELGAAQEYLALSAWCEQHGLRGFARFMRQQSQEETSHAMRIFDHIHDRGGKAVVGAVTAPKLSFGSARSVFEAALAREQANTRGIHDVYRLAVEGGDYPTQIMFHWFVNEQVEEERWANEALGLLDLAGEERGALLMLDREYGQKSAAAG